MCQFSSLEREILNRILQEKIEEIKGEAPRVDEALRSALVKINSGNSRD